MKLSSLGLALLAYFETFKPTAYRDQHGVLTIGYGHTGDDVTEGMTCTYEQAVGWLTIDVARAEEGVSDHVKVIIAQHEFDAMVSLAFNIGVTAFANSTLLSMLNAAEDAADQFLVWDRIAGQTNSGLLARRHVERALFLDGGA